jgi:hypothetical protein
VRFDSHPNSRRHLQRQFVVLERRRKADYSFRNKNSRFCERMVSLNLDVRELIRAARRADHRLLPNKTGECLRSNALCSEIFQPKHSSVFEEAEGTKVGAIGKRA